MKRCFYTLLVALSFSSCLNIANNNDLVSARWVFERSDAQDIQKTAEQSEFYYGGDGYANLFAASKFIIRPDNSFDFNLFENYRHGKWEHRDRFLILRMEPNNDSLYFTIDTVAYRFMHLSIDSMNFRKLGRFVRPKGVDTLFGDKKEIQFMFKLDNETYKDEDDDPYSKENNQWRIRPAQSETAEQIKKRVLRMIDFHMLMYEDGWSRNKGMVVYTWFSSPLIIANNTIVLNDDPRVQADWQDCFYSPQEAVQGYALLQAGLQKKLKANMEIEGKFLRYKDLLEQLKKNID